MLNRDRRRNVPGSVFRISMSALTSRREALFPVQRVMEGVVYPAFQFVVIVGIVNGYGQVAVVDADAPAQRLLPATAANSSGVMVNSTGTPYLGSPGAPVNGSKSSL